MEAGWWRKIYPIRIHQPVLPTPSPGGTKSQDGGKPGGGVWTARKAPRWDAGTEQSEPGTGEKKAVLGLWTTHQEASQATGPGVLGKAGAQASAGPAGIWKPSSGGRRISDAEAGWRGKIYPIRTRQPALPTSSLEDKGSFFQIDFSCFRLRSRSVSRFAYTLENANHARGPIISSGRTHSSNCSFVSNSSSRADSLNVIPFSCAFLAIFAALS